MTLDTVRVENSPCPFCGAQIHHVQEISPGAVLDRIVKCGSCMCENRILSDEDAENVWNTRSIPAAIQTLNAVPEPTPEMIALGRKWLKEAGYMVINEGEAVLWKASLSSKPKED